MILSETVETTVVPRTAKEWTKLGYKLPTKIPREGISIKVKIAHLKSGSNIEIECQCDDCGTKYVTRFSRHNGYCYPCFGRRKMLGNKLGEKNAGELPSKAEIETILNKNPKNGKAALSKHFGKTIPAVNGWLKKYGIELKPYHGLIQMMPDDFKEYYEKNKPSKKELYEKYGVSYPTVKRWLTECGLVHVGSTTKKDVPPIEEMMKLNETLNTEELAKHYSVSPSCIVVWFRSYGVSLKRHGIGTSKEEGEFFNFINSIVPGFIQGQKSILRNGHLQLDVYHPELKIAFEYDGLFWHAHENRKDHREKWDQCLEAGITLYRVHSMEWTYKRDLVESMVRIRLGKAITSYHARKLKVREISSTYAKEFHQENHISGYSKSAVSFGLFDNDTLISVMSFSKNRYEGDQEWEIARFSTIKNTVVTGGANKLFRAFIAAYRPQSILTFSDLRWGKGRVYEKMGFKFIRRGPPTYWYYHPDFPTDRFSRMAFQKDKLEKKLKIFNPELSEYQNMINNRYYRYWDCGSDRYIWTAQ